MQAFTVKSSVINGQRYTPGEDCRGVFLQPNGEAVIITAHGPQLVEPGACVYPDPAAIGLYLMKPAAEVEAPEVGAMKDRMTALWLQMPAEVRAMFRPTKVAVLDAINDGQLDEVGLLIQGAQVPPEYEQLKSELLNMLT